VNSQRILERINNLTISQRILGIALVALLLLILMGFSNTPQLKEMAIAIQDFYYHPHTSANTARDLKFTANRLLSSKRNAEN
jgi:hypothetical protein